MTAAPAAEAPASGRRRRPSPSTVALRELGGGRRRIARASAKLRAEGGQPVEDDRDPATLLGWARCALIRATVGLGSWHDVAEAAEVLRRALGALGVEPFDARRLGRPPTPALPAPQPESVLDLMRNADALLVVSLPARDWRLVAFALVVLEDALEALGLLPGCTCGDGDGDGDGVTDTIGEPVGHA